MWSAEVDGGAAGGSGGGAVGGVKPNRRAEVDIALRCLLPLTARHHPSLHGALGLFAASPAQPGVEALLRLADVEGGAALQVWNSAPRFFVVVVMVGKGGSGWLWWWWWCSLSVLLLLSFGDVVFGNAAVGSAVAIVVTVVVACRCFFLLWPVP